MASGRDGRAVAEGMDRNERHENNSCSQEFSGKLFVALWFDTISSFIFYNLVAEKGEVLPGRIALFFPRSTRVAVRTLRGSVNLRLHFNHLPHIALSGPQSTLEAWNITWPITASNPCNWNMSNQSSARFITTAPALQNDPTTGQTVRPHVYGGNLCIYGK